MASRRVTDAGGRTWACREDNKDQSSVQEGQDVSVLCTTASVYIPVRITVGWRWTTMAEQGLASIITEASPVPGASR